MVIYKSKCMLCFVTCISLISCSSYLRITNTRCMPAVVTLSYITFQHPILPNHQLLHQQPPPPNLGDSGVDFLVGVVVVLPQIPPLIPKVLISNSQLLNFILAIVMFLIICLKLSNLEYGMWHDILFY